MTSEKGLSAQAGITLIEIIVSIFLIVLFSSILVASFPRIQASFSLSRATYKFAQDLRRVQDLSLSGAEYIDPASGNKISITGYGIYINKAENNKGYKIYADSCKDQKYTATGLDPACLAGDVVIEEVDINAEEKGVNISGFTNISGDETSIDFTPPNPTTTMQNIITGNTAEIIFSLDEYSDQTRKVLVNTSGLIEVK